MRGWIIKEYTIKGEFWGYCGGATRCISKDIRCAYIYRSKEMAERVANSHKGTIHKIVEAEINEVEET
jgi:hypothetical protein